MTRNQKIALGVVAVLIGLPLIGFVSLVAFTAKTARDASQSMGSYGMANNVATMVVPSAYPEEAAMAYDSYATADMAAMREIGSPSKAGTSLPPTTPKSISANDRLIIKNGQLSLVVKSIEDALTAIRGIATQRGGLTVDSRTVNYPGGRPVGSASIQVPVKEFETVITELKRIGKVQNESTQGTDVTEEYVDLDARLRSLKAAEEQLLLIMKQAVKIPDILEVRDQLTNIQSQIESLQGRMQYLDKKAAMATITIDLTTDPSVLPVIERQAPQWNPLATVKAALKSLLEVGHAILDIAIWFAIYLPLWLVIILIGWLLKRKFWPRQR